jgi:hypothetical protein
LFIDYQFSLAYMQELQLAHKNLHGFAILSVYVGGVVAEADGPE